MSWCCASILILGTGCTLLEKGGTGASPAMKPEPGTRAYFDQKIRGSYAFDGGELLKIGSSSGTVGMPTIPGVIRPLPGYSSFYVQQLEGLALQVISNNLVVLGKSVTNASGVATCQRSCFVSLVGTCPPQQGTLLRLLAVSDGAYIYSDGTQNYTLTAYREVSEPSFEDYLKICERDVKESVLPPIVSVVRGGASQPTLQPGVVRPRAIMPTAPGSTPTPIPMPNTNNPEPGTRAYYEQNIRDIYAFDGGELVRINGPSGPMPQPPGVWSSPQWVEGRALQVISNNLVVIGRSGTTVSGAATLQASCLVTLVGTQPPLQGENVRILARSDGYYNTYTDGSRKGSLTGYREVAKPTFEDYLKIYERDAKAAVVPPIMSVERVVNRPLPPPPGVLPGSGVPRVPGTPLSTTSPTNRKTFPDRLKEATKAEEASAQAPQVTPNTEPAPILRPLPSGATPAPSVLPAPLPPPGIPRPATPPAKQE